MVIVRKVGFNNPNYTNIYIGRASSFKLSYGLNGSSFGNPFPMKEEKERDVVCDMYELYFNDKILKDKLMVESLDRLKLRSKKGENFALLCFCYPKRCHGDTIKKYLDS